MFRIKYRLHRIYNIFNLSKEYGIRVFYDTSYREEARKERRKKIKIYGIKNCMVWVGASKKRIERKDCIKEIKSVFGVNSI